jgi:2-oxoacid:acceptor oxidoreductase gamma subunit (pyruvate/2-ketoisovalerate family)
MTQRLRERLARGEALDLRGDGKAGGGLVLAMQAFGAALGALPELDVQSWPLFSSARKGANVRAFLRVARGRVEAACQITRPDVALLMNEAAAADVDFAEGTTEAVYVVNTRDRPEEAARRRGLAGTIVTIDADSLGMRHLGRPLGNVGVFAALVTATELVSVAGARVSLEKTLAKRRLAERIVAANMSTFDEALAEVRVATVARLGESHARAPFRGYGAVPAGAQAALRSARQNHTAGYGRPGVKIEFADPGARCNGCSLCVVQCPEGIIVFDPDPARGALVRGAKFDDFCKVCRECVAACPLDLFHEVASVERPS